MVDLHGRVLYESLINPGAPVAAEATAVHGLRDRDLVGAPTWADIADTITDLLSMRSVAGYGVDYDQVIVGGGHLSDNGAQTGSGRAEPSRCDPGFMTQLVTNTRTLSPTDFAVPIDDRYFEDYATGAIYEYGYLTVAEQDIVGFRRAVRPAADPHRPGLRRSRPVRWPHRKRLAFSGAVDPTVRRSLPVSGGQPRLARR